jgi:F-type H+-transporting ATPase subunit gamma
VKNTQKITRAMKLVSAAKFARANTAVVAARPYGKAFDEMVQRLVAAAGDEIDSTLVAQRPERRALLVVQATDRGFCGSLNSNLFKFVVNFVTEKRKAGVEVEVMSWGKRARQFATRLGYKDVDGREKVLEKPTYAFAKDLAADLGARFERGDFDRVYMAFVEFRSALSQAPKVAMLLPVGLDAAPAAAGNVPTQAPNILVEPSVKALLGGLLRRKVASALFRNMLEGAASEHGARMTAMDSATNNANEVLRGMKIQYNRARQAYITKELIEITSGAQAL